MSMQQVQQSLRAMDTNSDGQITKMELFNALKKMNLQSGLFGNSSQVPTQISNAKVQYPGFSNIGQVQSNVQQLPQSIQKEYVKPQIVNNFVTSQIIPGTITNNNQIKIQAQPGIIQQQGIPKVITVQEYQPKRNVIHINEVIQPVIMTPPAVVTVPMIGPPPFMGPPMGPFGPMGMGMGFGPMGGMSPFGPMGMGPMGMMGPFGPMGMRPFGGPFGGMNPFAALFGGLFGF